MDQKELIQVAQKMRSFAYAPYSKYTVGASVETKNGIIIGGCNVESSSYGLTCCAERITLFNAVSQGFSQFKAMAIASKNGGFPCGACRQVIWELCKNIPILIVDDDENIFRKTSQSLLPNPFDNRKLK
jgi:cytidine deaminase